MGYRRFIAYVYEYRKGKKGDNCGFMKVEVRNHMCTIEPHLQVENLEAGEVCKVYGFVRKEGLMNGILLGSCKTEANSFIIGSSHRDVNFNNRQLDQSHGTSTLLCLFSP